MRLIDSHTFELKELINAKDVKYAALSHRWHDDEILFEDMSDFHGCAKSGVQKVRQFCSMAAQDGIDWVWVDTCCINKDSSAELSEAINSMYTWYQDAEICYAYLADIDANKVKSNLMLILSSVWFTRSWTLQELLAPKVIKFFDRSWKFLGTKDSLKHEIARGTYINIEALQGHNLNNFSISQRLCWASTRSATRVEDVAYSLLGIFDISMPLLYGEGTRAFFRLQEEIMKQSTDETIFAWESDHDDDAASGILAPSPSRFRTCGGMRPKREPRATGFSIANRGLSIDLDLIPLSYDTFVALLNCVYVKASEPDQQVGVYLRKVSSSHFDRVKWGNSRCRWIGPQTNIASSELVKMENAYVSSRISSHEPWIDTVQFPTKGLKFRDTPAYRSLKSEARISHRGSWNADKAMIEVPICYRAALLTFYVPESRHVYKLLQFGFDEDFNPVCLIVERDDIKAAYEARTSHQDPPPSSFEDMFDYRCMGWIVPMAENGIVMTINGKQTDLWPIKGDRERGLHCHLTKSDSDFEIELRMHKIKDARKELVSGMASEIWELNIIQCVMF